MALKYMIFLDRAVGLEYIGPVHELSSSDPTRLVQRARLGWLVNSNKQIVGDWATSFCGEDFENIFLLR